jgi:hypothetical protein
MERAKRNVHVSVVVEENNCEYLSTNFLHQIMFFFFFRGVVIATCQNSGTLQQHEHGCVMDDTRNIIDPTITSNRENHL